MLVSVVNILLFDSGMGGLSIFHEIRHQLPNQNYDFVFDNAYFPYGEQPESVVVDRCVSIISVLVAQRDIDLVVIACNTASTIALPALRTKLTIPVVGVVPAIKPAAAITKNQCIALVATPATVQRAYTNRLIQEFAASCQVIRVGTSELVIEAERKMAGYPVDMTYIENVLIPLLNQQPIPDTLILGCTHFPLLKEEIHQIMPAVKLVDSGCAVARRVNALLSELEMKTKMAEQREGKAFCSRLDHEAKIKSRILNQYGFLTLEELTFS